jgi:hypothetical protein
MTPRTFRVIHGDGGTLTTVSAATPEGAAYRWARMQPQAFAEAALQRPQVVRVFEGGSAYQVELDADMVVSFKARVVG